jgi:hypothetical protein
VIETVLGVLLLVLAESIVAAVVGAWCVSLEHGDPWEGAMGGFLAIWWIFGMLLLMAAAVLAFWWIASTGWRLVSASPYL